ncbi:MAG: hypothetical protein PHX61_14105 [Alphaproteobacteria bacterium]|nr:hypothetical protein [Alphaproteobacteria bacterium]
MSGYPKFYIINEPIEDFPLYGEFSHSEIWVEIETPNGIQTIKYSGNQSVASGFIVDDPKNPIYGNLIIVKIMQDSAITDTQKSNLDITEIYVLDTNRVNVLNQLNDTYQSLGQIKLPGTSTEWVDTNIGYDPLGPNSNSVTNTLLGSVGIDFRENLPHENGNLLNPEIDLYRFVASDIFIDSTSNDTYTIFDDGTSLTFYKVDGEDTLVMEQGAELEIRNVEETDGLGQPPLLSPGFR